MVNLEKGLTVTSKQLDKHGFKHVVQNKNQTIFGKHYQRLLCERIENKPHHYLIKFVYKSQIDKV